MMSPMEITFVLLSLIICGWIVVELVSLQAQTNGRPQFKIDIKPDDPLVIEAMQKARATLPRFEELRAKYPQFSSLVMGPVREDGGVNPVLVQSKTADGYIVRRAVNQPGGGAKVDGDAFEIKNEDIIDWMVYESVKRNRIHGAYTLRAVTAIARRDGIAIPAHVLKQEKKFVIE